MEVVAFIFDWSELIMTTYSKIAEWFCSPIVRPDILFGAGVTELFGFNPSPIYLIMGPGLTIVLGYLFVKWILDIVL